MIDQVRNDINTGPQYSINSLPKNELTIHRRKFKIETCFNIGLKSNKEFK